MSSYLKNSFGFTSGAFTALNTGESGKGWGINTATFFEPVLGKVFNVSHRGGIIIDFYSFINMNPFEKLDFLLDIPIDTNYFNVVQSDNLLFVYPKTAKIIEDNFQNTNFECSVICANSGTKAISINFKIVFKREILSGPIEYTLNYTENIHSIPLSVFVKESLPDNAGLLTPKFSILSINGNIPTIDSVLAISNGYLDLTKLPIGTDSNMVIKYEDTGLGSNYEFKLNLFNRLMGEQQETKVLDIFMEITPVDGNIFDIKDYVSGDTRNIICNDVSSITDLPFKFQVCGSIVGITPITTKAIAIMDNKIFVKKMSYQTAKSKGVFNISILLTTMNTSRDLSVLKKLEPVSKNVLFTVTDGNLTNGEFFNFEALLGNRIFDNYIPRLSDGNTNTEINNVNGANLKNNGTLTVPSTIPLTFETDPGYYGLSGRSIYPGTISLISDNIPYKDQLDVSPIVFNVSKNYGIPKNLYDYISAPGNYYKDLTFTDKGGKLFINPNTQIISIKPTEYVGIDIENNTFNGIIEVKHSSYVNNNTKDDLGNIIGYREIPYTINYINKPYSSMDIEVQNIKLFYDALKQPLQFELNYSGLFGYIDSVSIGNNKSKIEILENPVNTIPVNISSDGTDPNKINICLTPVGYMIILDPATYYLPPVNSTLKLLIKYTNELNIETVYEQNIFFLKKEI